MAKILQSILLSAVFLALLVSPALGAGPTISTVDQRFTDDKVELIEVNLVNALQSNSPSIKTSAALVLRQVKELCPRYDFSRAVIPLMAALKDESLDPAARITAALALHEMHSAMGSFVISRTALLTGQERVKRICNALRLEQEKNAARNTQNQNQK